MSNKKSIEELNEELEPQVTSSDPNERKLARRLRIERRWEALKKKEIKSEQQIDGSNSDNEENDEIHIQLKKSAEILEKLLLEGEEYITNVRVANDSREVDRREYEGINKEKIYDHLNEEASSAYELFQSIASKWTLIQRHNDPLHINEAIMEQKEKCDMLISQKDAIIAMLNDELKNAERQFTKDQKKQTDDINSLSQRIEKQISFMRRAYREELNVLENVIVTERKLLIEATDKKWEDLFRKREAQEISNTKEKFEQVEEFNQRMEALRIDFQEHYRETKIKLENDIEELQRELEKIKALALLNSEKLDYNYQILKKREDENIIIKSQQKRRMNKLQDIINDLRGKIHDYETSTSNSIQKLKDNIRKLHQSIIDVEKKADHFAHVNDEKFHMIWEMNKSRALVVLNSIMDTDKVLYEQHLGLDWEQPQNYIIEKISLSSYKIALQNVEPNFLHEYFSDQDNQHIKSKKSATRSMITTSSGMDHSTHERDEAAVKNYQKILKHILKRISDKSGFLAEKRLKELLKGYVDDQKHLVRLDNVFAALGIQGSIYFDILFKHFQPYTYCPVCQGSVVKTVEKRNSAVSQRLSIHAKPGGDIFETQYSALNEVENAVRQPDVILDAIINDLVTTPAENLSDEECLSSEPSVIDIDNICGATGEEEQSSEISKEKSKNITVRSKLGNYKQEQSECQFRHPLVISPVYVLKALREFVSSYYVQKVGVPTTGARLKRRRMTISRYMTETDIRTYWEKFKLNFSEDRVRAWDALLEGLKKYHEILKDRRNICEEVTRLRKENSELRRLLSNYLDHHEFLPAPCANERNQQ